MNCNNPGAILQPILEAANSSQNISEVIGKLAVTRGAVVGANESFSAQQSSGNADPRIYISMPCAVITFTLLGQSLEVGLLNQRADPAFRDDVGGGHGRLNLEARGEILVDLRYFPRGNQRFTAQEVVNLRRTTPTETPVNGRRIRHDNRTCSTCHNDVSSSGTRGSYGQRNITVGRETFPALVSPYYRQPGERAEGSLYCIPEDLRLLKSCRCGTDAVRDPYCSRFQSTTNLRAPDQPLADNAEMCQRIDAVLQLRPRQHCQFDPRQNHDTENARCFSAP